MRPSHKRTVQNPKHRREKATINSHYLDWGAKAIILKEVLEPPLKIAGGRRERGKKKQNLKCSTLLQCKPKFIKGL